MTADKTYKLLECS
jgi:hypothetical protein